jgi:PST family polysaccharide transporter
MERNESADLARATVHGTLWTYLAYYGGKVMVLISTIILARLLTKEDFGVAGYALTVIAFLDVLSDLGIGSALIYHRADPRAADTAFWLGLGIGSALFGVTWFTAPLVGAFFNDARAVDVTRTLALTFPIAALGNVHDMLLRKTLRFRRKLIPDWVQATSKGLVSILLALLGWGAWSLIWGQVAGQAIAVIAYWGAYDWRPTFQFGRSQARALLTYGLSIVSVNGLGMLTANIDYLFVGRFLGAAALGVYSLAFRIPELLILQFCNIVSRVIFPVFAKIRHDPNALRQGFIVSTRYIMLVTVPLGLGLALVAEPFILVVFGDKWVDAIPVMRAIAIYALLLSLTYNAGDVYKAQGRPLVLTYLSIVQGIILIPALYWAATQPGTIVAVGWTHAIIACITVTVELTVALRMLNTPVSAILNALRPAAIAGAMMTLAVWSTLVCVVAFPAWAQLLIAVALGGGTYIGALWVLERGLVLEASHTLRAALWRRSSS